MLSAQVVSSLKEPDEYSLLALNNEPNQSLLCQKNKLDDQSLMNTTISIRCNSPTAPDRFLIGNLNAIGQYHCFAVTSNSH